MGVRSRVSVTGGRYNRTMKVCPTPALESRADPMSERRLQADGRAAIGLTGGLASGKSSALDMFARLGARVISADAIVHGLYELAEVRSALRARFGDGIFDTSGAVDRRALSSRLSRRGDDLAAVESIVHPHVEGELRAFVAHGPRGSVNVCEVPLLFEGGLQGLFDLVLTIEAPAAVRRERASSRMTPDVFEWLDARQAGEEARSAGADLAYANTGSPEELRTFVTGVYERAQAMATGRAEGSHARA